MTWLKLTSVVTVLGVGGYTAAQFTEEVLPNVVEAAAQQSFTNVTDAAYLQHVITNDDWAAVLENTVAEARKTDAVSVDGTTLRWVVGDDCFYAEVPTPATEPVAARCPGTVDK